MPILRRFVLGEEIPEPEEKPGPEIVVTDPVPKATPEQRWTLASYPYYERAPAQ